MKSTSKKNLLNFNFTIADNTTWVGEDLLDFYANALLTFPTAKNVTVQPNVKSIIKLPSYNLGSILQSDTVAGATSWNNSGEGTLAEKSFSVSPIKVQLEFPKVVFENDFLSQYMKAGSNTDEAVPQLFERFITQQVMKQVGNDLEQIAWQGTSLSGSSYPLELATGLIKTMSADSTVIKVSSVTAVTSSNVIALVQSAYNAIPSTVFLNYFSDLKMYVSSQIARAYRLAQAQTGAGQGYNWASKDIDLNFLNIEMVECPGLGFNQIVIASEQNMLLLTDLAEDFEKDTSLAIIDLWKTLGIASLRIALRFKIGFGYKVGQEIVLCGN
jgi:hypothetical protein